MNKAVKILVVLGMFSAGVSALAINASAIIPVENIPAPVDCTPPGDLPTTPVTATGANQAAATQACWDKFYVQEKVWVDACKAARCGTEVSLGENDVSFVNNADGTVTANCIFYSPRCNPLQATEN